VSVRDFKNDTCICGHTRAGHNDGNEHSVCCATTSGKACNCTKFYLSERAYEAHEGGPTGAEEERFIDPEDLAKRISSLRDAALFNGPVADRAMAPMTEQYYLLAISALEQAERFATLSHYNEMRGQ
jgi:hypothetical protein